ncbi:DeoR family transcriptional regulator [Rhizobium sp. LjRoot98]|uniref:DeoR family transcriptional regulator n=1 Tax=Rhizobium sp. LjRoot98 TaxID=3342345 RepID=UPI003ECEFEAD
MHDIARESHSCNIPHQQRRHRDANHGTEGPNPRHTWQGGRVVAKEFSHKLNLSEDTIRRDLRELAGEGLLQRVHGGALPASQALADLSTRRKVSVADKCAIAKAAVAMVKEGQIVFLDGGTNAVAFARALPLDLRATVSTRSRCSISSSFSITSPSATFCCQSRRTKPLVLGSQTRAHKLFEDCPRT